MHCKVLVGANSQSRDLGSPHLPWGSPAELPISVLLPQFLKLQPKVLFHFTCPGMIQALQKWLFCWVQNWNFAAAPLFRVWENQKKKIFVVIRHSRKSKEAHLLLSKGDVGIRIPVFPWTNVTESFANQARAVELPQAPLCPLSSEQKEGGDFTGQDFRVSPLVIICSRGDGGVSAKKQQNTIKSPSRE